jgi:protein-S-isoprenylcysteine O-methyltransferase Ste14/chorismate mutase
MFDSLGHFLFRHRNMLFPLTLAVLVAVFHPLPLGLPLSNALLAGGLVLAIAGQILRVITIGLDYIKRGGKDGKIYANRLVTGGIYRHTRNPMYAGNILILIGMFMVCGNPWAVALGSTLGLAAYMLIMASEERYLLGQFGELYSAYCARVPRWLPRMRGFVTTLRSYHFDWPAVIVKEYGTIFSTFAILTALIAWKAQRADLLKTHWVWFAVAGALLVVLWGVARYLKKVTQLKPRGVTPVRDAINLQRRSIDILDAAILELLNERARHVSDIFDIKRTAGMPRFDPERENYIITRLSRLNQGPLTDEQIETIFRFMLRHFAFRHDLSKGDQLVADQASGDGLPTQQVEIVVTATTHADIAAH